MRSSASIIVPILLTYVGCFLSAFVRADCSWQNVPLVRAGTGYECAHDEFTPSDVSNNRLKKYCCKMPEQCYFVGDGPNCGQPAQCQPGDLHLGDHARGLGGSKPCQPGRKKKFCCNFRGPALSGKDGHIHITLYAKTPPSGIPFPMKEEHVMNLDEGAKCINLQHPKYWSAMDTHGGYVTIYDSPNCRGGSSAVVGPGTPSHHDLNGIGFSERIQSVGAYGGHRMNGGDLFKRGNWAQRFEFFDPVIHFGVERIPFLEDIHDWLTGGQRVTYQLGQGGRTEFLQAHITRAQLNTGSATNGNARSVAGRMGEATDDAGHVLGRILGGSGTDMRNIFPQSRTMNRGEFAQMERDVRSIVEYHGQVIYSVHLLYATPTATRPYELRVRMEYTLRDTGERKVLQGSFPNPL